MSPTDSDLHELKETHLAAKNTAQSCDLGDSMKPDSWLWGVLKPEDLSESAEEEWVTESALVSFVVTIISNIEFSQACEMDVGSCQSRPMV